jgi:hypothetical protein
MKTVRCRFVLHPEDGLPFYRRRPFYRMGYLSVLGGSEPKDNPDRCTSDSPKAGQVLPLFLGELKSE